MCFFFCDTVVMISIQASSHLIMEKVWKGLKLIVPMLHRDGFFFLVSGFQGSQEPNEQEHLHQ